MHSKLFSWRQNNSRSYFAKIIPVIIHSPQNLCRGKTQQSFTGDEDSHSFLLDWTRTGDRQSRSLRTMEKLVKMMQLQLQRQREEMQQQREKMQAQEQRFREQAERHAHMTAMLQLLAKTPQSGQVFPPATVSATPTFLPFDSTSELWKDYWSRFLSFTRAHAVPDDRQVQVFLTNSRWRCISYFLTLLHKKRRRGRSTILRWSRSWRTWRCNLIQPVSSSGHVSSSGLPCNVDPGSHSRAGCTHTSSSGHVRFCFHCRPLGRSITYALHFLSEQWSGS